MMVVSLKPFKARELETVRVGNACLILNSLVPLECVFFVSLCVSFFFM